MGGRTGQSKVKKVVCIAWAPHSNRLDSMAEGVGGTSVKISVLSGRKYLAPLRYVYLGFRTLSILRNLKADVVIAQNPPIFCPLSAYLYAKLYGKRVGVDCHSLARDKLSQGFIWKALASIELFLMRRAFVNTVIHEAYSSQLACLGVKSIVLCDSPPDIEVSDRKPMKDLRVVVPLGGHPDEDVDSMLKVADSVDGIVVMITGSWKGILERPNVEYRGFLPREDYLKLLLESKAGMCLLRGNEMTLPFVLFEFAAAGLPFVVTKTQATKGIGEMFLVGSAQEAASKLTEMKDPGLYASMEVEVGRLRGILLEKSREGMERLRGIIEALA